MALASHTHLVPDSARIIDIPRGSLLKFDQPYFFSSGESEVSSGRCTIEAPHLDGQQTRALRDGASITMSGTYVITRLEVYCNRQSSRSLTGYNYWCENYLILALSRPGAENPSFIARCTPPFWITEEREPAYLEDLQVEDLRRVFDYRGYILSERRVSRSRPTTVSP